MLGAGDAVLVLVGFAEGGRARGGEGFGEPVGGADEGCFAVEVVGACLLSCGVRGDVEGCGGGGEA